MLNWQAGTLADAAEIAQLHAASWQRTYAGQLAADFLAGPVLAERAAVWQQRLAAPSPGQQVWLVRAGATLVGFYCLYPAHHPQWGHCLDNLHVAAGWQGQGVGRQLLQHAAAQVALLGYGPQGLYLYCNQANTPALAFYLRLGASQQEAASWAAPDGQTIATWRVSWPAGALDNFTKGART
ncbi:GNAT family N-acetyltransferase [Chitinibacter tainanensis]|uniref:GNAT family N-acetyltransferase n=1 Tax=Chitinibacter tainanensis TaxID=230667 RepID=UPI000421C9EB|nr:GNAT family N-acetyltransferase [Chitinibacter tainanensis]